MDSKANREEVDLTGNRVVVAAKDQVSCTVGNEAIILHCSRGVYFGLNSVGAAIWNLVQQPRTVAEILRFVLENYDVSPARGKEDVLSLLRDMADTGLISYSDNDQPSHAHHE